MGIISKSRREDKFVFFFFRSFRFWNLKSKKNLENNTHFLPKIRSSWKKYPIIAKKNNSWQKNPKFLKNKHSNVVKISKYWQQSPGLGEKHPIFDSKYPIIVKNTPMFPKISKQF